MFQDDNKHMYVQFNFHITNLVPDKSCLCEKYFLDILIKVYFTYKNYEHGSMW